MDFKDLPCFKPKKQKLLAAMLVLLEEASRVGKSLSRGEIVKSLFIADDAHLQKYGRPITFDNYVAMKNGPVGDLAIDLLNDNVDWSEFGLEDSPWIRKTARYDQYLPGRVAANRKKLSPSDIEELLTALHQVSSAGFGLISHLTHEHPAWRSAWGAKSEGANAAAMDWRRFPSADISSVGDLVAASWSAA